MRSIHALRLRWLRRQTKEIHRVAYLREVLDSLTELVASSYCVPVQLLAGVMLAQITGVTSRRASVAANSAVVEHVASERAAVDRRVSRPCHPSDPGRYAIAFGSECTAKCSARRQDVIRLGEPAN